MFKLTLVSGPTGAAPARGSSFVIRQGETSIGRQSGNVIVLDSKNVSKRHCTLVVNNGEVLLRDQGSSNGTFVNGVLAKTKAVRAGDRVSVGDFVFELSKPAEVRAMNVIPFPNPLAPGHGGLQAQSSADLLANQAPGDLKGKAFWYFENHVMPIAYNLNLRHEWKILGLGLIGIFILSNLVITVWPLMESNRVTVVREAGRRAKFMARQIVERNSAALAARTETKTEIGSIDREDGVRLALLTDLDNRIIAPASQLNQYLTSGAEANFAVKAANLFKGTRETGMVSEVDSSTIVAIEPVKVLNPQLGRNVIVGMAIVSLDTTLSTPDFGEMGVVYSETLILTGLLGALLFLILYRLTLKPFQVLNDDIDRILKGEATQVTREFKFEEMNPLWDVIGSALKRVPRNDGHSDAGLGMPTGAPDEYLGPVKMLGEISKAGLVVCDENRRVLYMNSMFEEMSGIRSDNALGNELASVARDQAFGSLSNDLFDRAPAGGDGVSEDFEFSGISYRVHAAAFGASGAPARCFVLAAARTDGG